MRRDERSKQALAQLVGIAAESDDVGAARASHVHG
jgi:hypothetical protein